MVLDLFMGNVDDINEFRGAISNRGLTKEYSPGELTGIIDPLCLTENELRGKVLDVGTGGGQTVAEGGDKNKDIVGVDIIPAQTNPKTLWRREHLVAIAKKYPWRIVASDAAKALPFKDDAFDTVISHMGLPAYARSPKEVATSIFEMVRVAKKHVVFTSWSGKGYNGLINLGGFNKVLLFPMQAFLENLSKAGVSYEEKVYQARIPSIHLDVGKKDNDLLGQLRKEF